MSITLKAPVLGAMVRSNQPTWAMTDPAGTAFAERCYAALEGHGWQSRLSDAIGCSTSTIRRWTTGETPIPEYVIAILELLERTPIEERGARWGRRKMKAERRSMPRVSSRWLPKDQAAV